MDYWDDVKKKYAGKNEIDGGPVPLRRWMDPNPPGQSPKDKTESRPRRTKTPNKK